MTSKAPTSRATRFSRPRAALLVAMAALPLLAGCGQLRGHQGFIYDQTLAGQILPGVDNRQSVERTLGRPTFTGQFSDSEWYYFARDTRQLAFATPRPTAQQVIPLVVEEGAAANTTSYEYEPEEDEILTRLLPRNLAVQIFRALLENNASFYGAQMSAMDNATRNAGEMIRKQTLVYNRTRQAQITKELIEIISGAEAV